MTAAVRQVVLVSQATLAPNKSPEQMAMFDSDGNPATAVTFDDIPTGADVVLTGFTTGSDTAVADTDTVNAGIAKVQAKATAAKVASNVLLTGYAIAGAASAVAASDSVMAAIAKLEKRIADLETP